MKLIAILSLFLAATISGCASYPSDAEEQASYWLKEAKNKLSRGDCDSSAVCIDSALLRPTGANKVSEAFSNDADIAECYILHLKRSISTINDAYSARRIYDKLKLIKDEDILSGAIVDDLYDAFYRKISEGNITGNIPFILGDNIENYPVFNESIHKEKIIQRTIDGLRNQNSERRPVKELMQYIEKHGIDSKESNYVKSALPDLNITRDELEYVRKVFPEFAELRSKELTIDVNFELVNGDRLIEDDLRKIFHERIKGVNWVRATKPGVVKLVVEVVRNNERILPEQSQTITYAQYQVNLLSAALLMPKNASYHYEVITGGVEIEYGYIVRAYDGESLVYENVVRGTEQRKYSKCQNARIQNVFGGVSAASFIANNDMQSRCSGVGFVSLDQVRKDIYKKIVDDILNIPIIRKVHKLN